MRATVDAELANDAVCEGGVSTTTEDRSHVRSQIPPVIAGSHPHTTVLVQRTSQAVLDTMAGPGIPVGRRE